MLLSLITNKRYIAIRLPKKIEGTKYLCDPDTGIPLFQVSADNDRWKLLPESESRFIGATHVHLSNEMLLKVVAGASNEKGFIYSEDDSPAYDKFAKCKVSDPFSVSFGTSLDNRFCSNNSYVDTHHFKLIYNNHSWSILDNGSVYGTYINGKRVGKGLQKLNPGDMVSVFNQKFILLPGILVFNGQSIIADRIKGKLEKLSHPHLHKKDVLFPEKKEEWFRKSPRFIKSIEEESMTIQAPPTQKTIKEDKAATMLSYGPAVSSGLIMLLGGLNPIYGIGMAASSLLWPTLGRKRNEKLIREEEEKRKQLYEDYLQKVEQEIENIRRNQIDILQKKSLPPKKEAVELLNNPKSMWSRRPEHEDFLDVQVGTGNIPMQIDLSFPQENDIEKSPDPMIDRLHEIKNKPRELTNVPITLPISRFPSIGISGPSKLTNNLMASIILQIAMHIGYDDIKFVILGRLSEEVSDLKWLPHTWDDQFAIHYIAETEDDVPQVISHINPLLVTKRGINGSNISRSEKQIIVLIAGSDIARSGYIERELYNKEFDNVHIISIADHGAELPNRTKMLISVRTSKGRMKWSDGNEKYVEDFKPNDSVIGMVEPIAKLMANTFLEMKKDTEKIPDVIPFLDVFGVKNVSHLNLYSRWKASDPLRSLRTPIGIDEDGSTCYLDLHQSADGPHGLIAGMTGSGKSEFLKGYILSMAVNYSPEEVSFVLIDYKGGGMAQAFEKLPHTVGIITNLDGNEIERSLMSINSELIRRQKLFSDVHYKYKDVSDIYAYQDLYRKGKVSEPLPHLIIITDEFAELKTQQTAFLQELISISRIGRSFGVHLILATQKPAGVVNDEIWSNSNFRICLKVETALDSQDVLKVPDAALLKRKGSFLKQVGYGEQIVKAQSTWTGADYNPDSFALPHLEVEILNSMGKSIASGEFEVRRKENQENQLTVVSNYIESIASIENIDIRKLWLPVLENEISLASLYSRYNIDQDGWTLNPVIGELDDPANQRRDLVRLNFSDGSNAIVYGSFGSGKLQFITTVIEDSIKHHTPDQLQIYILDYADDGLAALTAAPHIGDVLFSDDDEKLNRLVKYLKETIAQRKRLLGGALASESLESRLEKNSICRILVIIHHLLNFQDHAESILDEWKQVLSDGPRYGIHFLATAEAATGIRTVISKKFARGYVLKMDSDDDYISLKEITGRKKPGKARGRGILRSDNEFYEFQTATGDEDLIKYCNELKENWKGAVAQSIRIMPEQIKVSDLIPYVNMDVELTLPIGFAVKDISPIYLELKKRVIHTIIGASQDTEDFIYGVLQIAAEKKMNVVVFDRSRDYTNIEGVESLDLDDSIMRINDMYEECLDMRRKIDSGETLDDRLSTVFVLPAFSKFLEELDEETRKSIMGILKRGRNEWKWYFIISDTPQNINNYYLKADGDSWFKVSVSRMDAICLGASISQQTIIQTNAASYSLYKSNAFPFGHCIENGEITQAKFISVRDW